MKNRWALTTKYHIDDNVEREKARLVVKGFTQVYGADYDETYTPPWGGGYGGGGSVGEGKEEGEEMEGVTLQC
ncbi:unnamed protein product [Closterium sp. NIES-64]|nr:unnamed protein product [Closterium sp. NIES-64]